MPGDAHLFLLPLAFARGLEQAEDRLRHIGIADEDALDRPHVLRAGRPRDQRQIGGVGIDHVAVRIGDHEPVIGMVGDAAHDGVVGGAAGETDDAGGKGEQAEQPDHGEQREHAEDIGLRLGAADVISATADRDQPAATSSTSRCCRPAAPAVGHDGSAGRIMSVSAVIQETLPVGIMKRPPRAPLPECLNRTGKRKSIKRLFDDLHAFRAGFVPARQARPEIPRLRPIT